MSKKEKSIRIRVTESTLDQLKELATAEGKSLSSYMIKKGLEEDTETATAHSCIPESRILLNEIYHQVKKYGDAHLESIVRSILSGKFLQNGGTENEEAAKRPVD